MKKKVIFVVLFVLILLTSCGTKLTSESFDDLRNGMTADEVIDILGKPNKSITKKSKVEKIIDEQINTYSSTLSFLNKTEDPEFYKEVYDVAMNHSEAKALLDRGKNVEIFIYDYKIKYEIEKEVEKVLIFYNNELFAY